VQRLVICLFYQVSLFSILDTFYRNEGAIVQARYKHEGCHPVEVKVVVAISRLATDNSIQSIADLYKIGLSSSQVAVSQFAMP